MTDIVPVNPSSDFSDLRITRSETGHCHSPWFTYDWKKYHSGSPYTCGSHFHNIRRMAIFAFSSALGITERQVLVTSREDPETGEVQWRLGTQHPCELPRPKLSQSERMQQIEQTVRKVEDNKDAIDI